METYEPLWYLTEFFVSDKSCKGIFIYVYNTTKIVKKTNYILVNAWRHVSAVLAAILKPSSSTDQA
jgi:hypothetical protein